MVNPIHVNPSVASRHLTEGGSDWLWVVTTLMGFSTLAVFTWAKLVGLSYWYFALHVFHQTSIESNLAERERFIILLWLSSRYHR
jgi:bacteriorhodopsin